MLPRGETRLWWPLLTSHCLGAAMSQPACLPAVPPGALEPLHPPPPYIPSPTTSEPPTPTYRLLSSNLLLYHHYHLHHQHPIIPHPNSTTLQTPPPHPTLLLLCSCPPCCCVSHVSKAGSALCQGFDIKATTSLPHCHSGSLEQQGQPSGRGCGA